MSTKLWLIILKNGGLTDCPSYNRKKLTLGGKVNFRSDQILILGIMAELSKQIETEE